MSVFRMLHYRSVVVGALLASLLTLCSNFNLSTLPMSSQQDSKELSLLDLSPALSAEGVIVAAESGSSSAAPMIPILRPNVCPYMTSRTAAAFDKVYETSLWGHPIQNASDFYSGAAWPPKERKSASGTGSQLGYSSQVSLQVLQGAIRKFDVNTMIDLPCGDANWIFDSLETDTLELYIGLDIVKRVVEETAARLAHHSNKIFRHWDGAKCPLPKIVYGTVERSVDLVHARDVLQHLKLEQGIQFLCHVFQSGARVFVTTTFPRNGNNRAIQEGEFYLNDLSAAPFNLPAPKNDNTVTCTPTHPKHELDETCVYDLTQPWVAAWIAEKKCDALQYSEGASPK
jgi:hypothetical protein